MKKEKLKLWVKVVLLGVLCGIAPVSMPKILEVYCNFVKVSWYLYLFGGIAGSIIFTAMWYERYIFDFIEVDKDKIE